MKIKLDENLPRRLVRFLNDLGQDTDTVFDERLTGQPRVDEPSESVHVPRGRSKPS